MKIYLATQASVTTVQTQVTTIDQQLNNTGGIENRLSDLETGGIAATKFRLHSSTADYEIGEVVLFGGALFSANSAINGTAAAVSFSEGAGVNKWTRTGGSTPLGTIVHWEGVRYSLAVPDGYWLCNGTTINYPGSLLNGLTAPDHRDRVLAAANGGTNTANTTNGSDSATIARNNLPNINLSGSTTYTPSGSISYNEATNNSQPNTFATAATVVSNEVGGDLSGSVRKYAAIDSETLDLSLVSTEHTHVFSGTTTVLSMSNISLNGNVAQAAINNRQATRYVTTLIKL